MREVEGPVGEVRRGGGGGVDRLDRVRCGATRARHPVLAVQAADNHAVLAALLVDVVAERPVSENDVVILEDKEYSLESCAEACMLDCTYQSLVGFGQEVCFSVRIGLPA